jgi:hypothetical protein
LSLPVTGLALADNSGTEVTPDKDILHGDYVANKLGAALANASDYLADNPKDAAGEQTKDQDCAEQTAGDSQIPQEINDSARIPLQEY